MIFLALYITALFNMTMTDLSPTVVLENNSPVITIADEAEATIKWYSWEEAMAANENQPKKIFVDLYTNWCGWCKKNG